MSDTPERSHERPPGPPQYPILGSLLSHNRNPFDFVTENARTYGDVVYWELADKPIYQVNHPDDIEYVLVENNQNYVKGELFQDALRPVLGEGLLNSEGQRWRRQRHLIQPSFHPNEIQEYAEIMVSATESLLGSWTDRAVIDIHEEMMGLTLRIVAESLLGVELEREIETIGENLEIVLGHVDRISHRLVPPWVPTPSNKRYQEAIRNLETVVSRIIENRRRDPGGTDVVSILLDVEDEHGRSMSDRQLRDEIMTFLLAGHETTALALTYTFYLLAKYPQVEKEVVEEIRGTLGEARPTATDRRRLSVTERTITESMRLYPPVDNVVREAVEADRVGGYSVPAGSTIWLSQWVVHRDPRWYPDPLAFDPSRWTGEFRDSLPRLAYFPFGAGPRRCVGDQFALLEATLVLTTILREYHLELTRGTDLELMSAITARPKNPVWMEVQAR